MKFDYFESIDSSYAPLSTIEIRKDKSTSSWDVPADRVIYSGYLIQKMPAEVTKYFVLDQKYLWCKTELSSEKYLWKLEMKFIKILLLQNTLVLVRGPQTKFGFKLCYGETSWTLVANDRSEYDSWISSLTKVAIRCDLHERLKVKKVVGAGAFAKVYSATDLKTKIPYAIKGFNKKYLETREKGKLSLSNEISILRELSHRNVLKLREVDESENSIYLVFDLYEGGDLYDHMKKKKELTSKEIIGMIEGILIGLEHLRELNIVHRDIKPNNILLRKDYDIKPDDVVIADFGLSAHSYDSELIFPKCGTPGYLAPEIIASAEAGKDPVLDPVSDIFGVGIILYMMLTNRNPFENKGNNTREVMKNNTKCLIDFTLPSIQKADPNVRRLLQCMLVEDPRRRLSAKDCLESSIFFKRPSKPDTTDYSIGTEEFTTQELCFRENSSFEIPTLSIRRPNLTTKQEVNKFLQIPSFLPSTQYSSTLLDTLNQAKSPRINDYKLSISTVRKSSGNSSSKAEVSNLSVIFKKQIQHLPSGPFTSLGALCNSTDSIASTVSILNTNCKKENTPQKSHFGNPKRQD